MFPVNPKGMSLIARLFEGHKRRRYVIDHAIEGNSGTAVVDDERNPRVAQLTVGQVTLFGGNPNLPVTRRMVESLPRTIATPETRKWHDLICGIHGAKIQKRSRVEFASEGLNPSHLQELKMNSTRGFRIERIDMDLVRRLDKEIGGGFFGKFRSPEQFLEIGIGFCGIIENRVVCGALSGVTCKRGISIQIQTHSDFLRRGFATSVGAALILHCLENGIEPHWSAATPISASLAEKFGYVQSDSYEELLLLV